MEGEIQPQVDQAAAPQPMVVQHGPLPAPNTSPSNQQLLGMLVQLEAQLQQLPTLLAQTEQDRQVILAQQAQINELQAIAQEVSTSGRLHVPSQGYSKLPAGVKPPTPGPFHGDKDINSLDTWVFAMGEYFAVAGLSDDRQRIQYAGLLLKGPALVWYRTLVTEGRPPGYDWATFVQELRQNFCPINAVRRARDRLARVRQDGSLQDFVREFRSICLEIPGITDEEKLDRFLRALHPRIRSEVELQDPDTLDKAIKLSEKFDAVLRGSRVGSSAHRNFHQHPGRRYGPAPMELGYMGRQSGGQQRGFSSSSYPNRSSPGQHRISLSNAEKARLMREGRCLYCKGEGHIARECPKKGNGSGGRTPAPRDRSPAPTGSRA